MIAVRLAPWLLFLLCAGCVGTGLPPPEFPARSSAPAAPVVPSAADADPFRLDAARRAWLFDRIDPQLPDRMRLDALVDLFRPGGELHLDYALTTSLPAEGTLAEGMGNCLSFTVAFVALARALSLEAHVQEVVIPRLWSREGDVVVSNRHVVAWGRLPDLTWEVDFGRFSRPDSAPRHLLDTHEVAAILASNQGADALIRGDDARAADRLTVAVALEPRLTQAWTNLAVLRARQGDPAAAERAFRRVLERVPGDPSSLSGLLRLYRVNGRQEAAMALEAAMPRLLERNPWYLYREALDAEGAGEDVVAVQLYRQALRRQPDEPWFHLGLIRTQLRLADVDGAERALARARRELDSEAELGMVLARLTADPAPAVAAQPAAGRKGAAAKRGSLQSPDP